MKFYKFISVFVFLLCCSLSDAIIVDTTKVFTQQLSDTDIVGKADSVSRDLSCVYSDFPGLQDDSLSVDSVFFGRLDRLMHDLYVENAFQIDCSLLDTVPVYCSDSVYMARLQSLPHIMEMPFNAVVKRCIELYARCPRNVGYMLAVGNSYYFNIFEEALERYNVPLELRYLPVIESALNAKAKSPMGASGLWQFMIGTGKMYGLEVSSLVDERRDARKASDAAARFLSDLYKIYGDWHLVIAAYNCGPGNVSKAIRYASGKRDYWKIYPYLPRETRGYVPMFIAANYIMNFYKEHNICPADPKFDYRTDTVMISDRVHLQQIAEKLNIPLAELQFLNPQYRYDIIPGNIKPYSLVLPFEHINSYALNRDSILAYKPELAARQIKVEPSGGDVIYYRVKSGDTLGGIAARYHVSVSKLKKWNGLRSTMIRIGQRLKIYK